MQRQFLIVLTISCVLAGSAIAQSAGPGSPLPPPHSARRQAAAANAAAEMATISTTKVPMDQPVITLKGGCQPIGDMAPSKDCVSDVTRAQFEKLITALQPTMGADARRGFATNYARLLI